MARRRRSRIPGLSFSWKRALGVTKAKRKIAKLTGIPTTRTGRQRKLARMLTGGCLLPILTALLIITLFIIILF